MMNSNPPIQVLAKVRTKYIYSTSSSYVFLIVAYSLNLEGWSTDVTLTNWVFITLLLLLNACVSISCTTAVKLLIPV